MRKVKYVDMKLLEVKLEKNAKLEYITKPDRDTIQKAVNLALNLKVVEEQPGLFVLAEPSEPNRFSTLNKHKWLMLKLEDYNHKKDTTLYLPFKACQYVGDNLLLINKVKNKKLSKFLPKGVRLTYTNSRYLEKKKNYTSNIASSVNAYVFFKIKYKSVFITGIRFKAP